LERTSEEVYSHPVPKVVLSN